MTQKVAIFCNPLLDIVADCDEKWFEQYQLYPGSYTEYKPSLHKGLYEQLAAKPKALLLPGGAGQNTASIVSALGGSVTFFGCVGSTNNEIDKEGQIMEKALLDRGVEPRYVTTDKASTGISGLSIHPVTRDRSLCTMLGASQFFNASHLRDHAKYAEGFQIVYATGFFVTATEEGMRILCEKVGNDPDRVLVVSLSAPFIVEAYQSTIKYCTDLAQIVCGNETEWIEYGKVNGYQGDIKQILQQSVRSTCSSSQQEAINICTSGSNPTIIAWRNCSGDVQVMQFPVKSVPSELISDTNGCGDAFLGGVIGGLLRTGFNDNQTIEVIASWIALGTACAQNVLQHLAFQFDSEYLSKLN